MGFLMSTLFVSVFLCLTTAVFSRELAEIKATQDGDRVKSATERRAVMMKIVTVQEQAHSDEHIGNFGSSPRSHRQP